MNTNFDGNKCFACLSYHEILWLMHMKSVIHKYLQKKVAVNFVSKEVVIIVLILRQIQGNNTPKVNSEQ